MFHTAFSHLFTSSVDNGGMESTRDHQPLLEDAQANAGTDPRRVLESLVCELECLLDDAPTAATSPFIELFAALLVFNLDGCADLVPSPSIGLSGHALRTWRVARSARAAWQPWVRATAQRPSESPLH